MSSNFIITVLKIHIDKKTPNKTLPKKKTQGCEDNNHDFDCSLTKNNIVFIYAIVVLNRNILNKLKKERF